MQPTPNNQLDRTTFNAIPIPAFVVNGDVQILDLNDAATQLCGQDLNMVFRIRAGEVLGCLRSMDVSGGCGRGEACHTCVIRTSVVSCLKWQAVRRHKVNLQLAHGLVVKDFQVLITVSPLPNGVEELALLMVEDITEFFTLKSPLHICMKCKKIRDDQQNWTDVEKYLHEDAGVDISLGMCPTCVEKYSESH